MADISIQLKLVYSRTHLKQCFTILS